jgi:two-component system, cell cycle sensor histidine kinase and response regulator CckA
MNRQTTLLVVEDDSSVRRFIVRSLKDNGFRVIEAAGAAESLEILRSEADAIDLVITDVVMPRMGGLDLAAELDRQYPGLKILYVSGYTASIAIAGIAQRSPHLVLLKPFTEEMLLDRVRRLCSRGEE